MAGKDGGRSAGIAQGGVLAAGSLAVLWLACAAPSGKAGLTAAAGLFPAAAVLGAGRATGYLCWAAAGLLGLFLLPDKGVAVMFLAFLGLYPVVKSHMESLRRLWLEWCLKLLFFYGELALFCLVLRPVFLAELPGWLTEHRLLFGLAGGGVFVVYDLGLSKLVTLLGTRMRQFGRH